MASRQLLRLTRDKTAFLCCDIQTVFQSTIHRFDHVAHTASILVNAGRIFNVAVIVSEQYPEKLGKTVSTIDVNGLHVYPKVEFSMITDGFPNSILTGKDTFVLFGIETHVCVMQTAIDLLIAGKHVVLVTDAVSSSRELDRSTALHRLTHAGVVLMTAESVMFDLMRTKNAAEFKQISALAQQIAQYSKDYSTLSSL